jgi:hypothetical protein
LGKDLICMSSHGEEYDETEMVYYKRKDIWLGRRRMEKNPICGEIFDMKIRVERNGIELILGAKIYSLLNLNSMNKYLSTIT